MQPIEVNGKPSIFLAHGRQDQTMPIDVDQPDVPAEIEGLVRRHLPRIPGTAYATAGDPA